jgi:ribosomal protein S6
MGMKDLAQPFDKHNQGYYVHSQFHGNNAVLEEIQRNIAVSEDFLRHLVVTVDSITVHKRPIEPKKPKKGPVSVER